MTVFDHIIAGRLPASFVHQDEQCVAFMDIRPIRPGHVLVVPRQSVPTLDELTGAQRAHLFEVAGRVARAQRQALGSRAQHLLVNDGRAASQTVPHVHIHVIPRYLDDSMTTLTRMIWHLTTLRLPRRERLGQRTELEALASRIRAVGALHLQATAATQEIPALGL
jgi:histidine triad (HIT) family protein